MVLSPSPFFSVLFIELQEQHSYLNYPYRVILPEIYVALFWSSDFQQEKCFLKPTADSNLIL